ncbi:MAG: hypothetical protein GQ574_12960 [Crocinitomix sp.]|nr:hypothetical protein [Crocinitomix sp.]
MMRRIVFYLFIYSSFLSCKKESTNCGVECTDNEELLFQTGFNGTSIVDGEYSNAFLSGTDPDFDEVNSWEEFQNNSKIGSAEISYEEGSNAQRSALIVADLEDAGNSVIKFNIIEPHIKEGNHEKGRVQLNVNNNQCIREIYQTVRLKLHPDLAQLKEWEEPFYWFSIFEFWNNADWTKEKFPFRITVNLNKSESGPVENIYFNVKG